MFTSATSISSTSVISLSAFLPPFSLFFFSFFLPLIPTSQIFTTISAILPVLFSAHCLLPWQCQKRAGWSNVNGENVVRPSSFSQDFFSFLGVPFKQIRWWYEVCSEDSALYCVLLPSIFGVCKANDNPGGRCAPGNKHLLDEKKRKNERRLKMLATIISCMVSYTT